MAIDRRALVARHNPHLFKPDPNSPLSVGNGEFAFTADVTGLQSFPEAYESGAPLCTQAQWGWHTAPYSESEFRFDRSRLRLTDYDTGGRIVRYPTSDEGQEKAFLWLRQNPHRLHLGRIGLRLTLPGASPARLQDLAAVNQKLDLWEGLLHSRFALAGATVAVKTCCHPELDAVSFFIESELAGAGLLAIRVDFPYGSPEKSAADWAANRRHATGIVSRTDDHTALERVLDKDRYYVSLRHPDAACDREGEAHRFVVRPAAGKRSLELTVLFTPGAASGRVPSFAETASASLRQWAGFWERGGVIELAGSSDGRAAELERRIVLSQYLTAIQCAGSLPPQETGLTGNSWYGKFHLEMHWWHAAHFALWERAALLEKSLAWYRSILPKARAAAAGLGYRGARWPKMTSGEGEESPSAINPLIIWQQPHLIYLAELVYRGRPTGEILARYRDLVFESAEFMVSFVAYDAVVDRYCLLPPIVLAQENHEPQNVLNPTFELEYWHFGLRTAQAWKRRLGLPLDPLWEKVAAGLARPPVKDGLYAAHERCAGTFSRYNFDHPSFLCACGFLPGDRVDKTIMARTLGKTLDAWRMDKVWGWDFPLIAMTAARLRLPEAAVGALFIDSPQNEFLPNGHNRQGPERDLPVYLPGNGALLAAVGMMASGWDGDGGRRAPGFPEGRRWRVAWEDIRPMP